MNQYLWMIKICGVAVALAASFFLGRGVGVDSVQPELAAANLATETVKKEWAEEKTKLTAAALVTLSDAIVKVRKEEKAQRDALEIQQVKYRKTIRELKDEKARIDINIGTNGLWAQSTSCEPTASSSSDYTLSGAAANTVGLGNLYRCKLSEKTALDLSQLVFDADELVVKYNRCVEILNLERK